MNSRIDALTGLRFVAALAVYASHLQRAPGAPPMLQTFLWSGYDGVTLFFILSGFVLAWNAGDRFGDGFTARALWSYGVARLARIYPLYLFALCFAVAPYVADGRPRPFVWWHVFAVQTWSGDVRNAFGYNAPGWSIGVELFLYACFPLLLAAVRPVRRNPRALIVLAVGAVAFTGAALLWAELTGRAALPSGDPDSAHRWLYRSPLTRLGDFTLGMAGAFLVPHWRTAARWGPIAQFVGGVTMIALMCSSAVFYSAPSFDALSIVPMFLLIAGLAGAPGSMFGRLLSTPVAVLLGEASFALYLLHVTALRTLTLHWRPTFGHWFVAQVALFAAILCLALGAHHFIERPARRLLCRWLAPTRSADHSPSDGSNVLRRADDVHPDRRVALDTPVHRS
jgi:peptidoglycan/LPS O-acetylase OafA/YrhL